MSEHDAPSPEILRVVPPAAFVVMSKTETSIRVQWAYSAGPVTQTRLKWQIGDTMIDQVDLPIGTASYIVSNLNPGTRYRIRAYGLENDEESASGPYVDETTKPATALPASPTQLVATPASDAMVLTWTGVANASSYKLVYGLAPSGPVIKTDVSLSTRHAFTHLAPDTNYYFEVCSSNDIGDSAPVRVVKQTLRPPAAPASVRATPAVTTMDLQWSASPDALDYVIRFGVEPGGAVNTVITELLRATLKDLSKNTLYFAEVSARNHNGESAPARVIEKTLDGPPIPSRPGPLHTVTTHHTIRVVWASYPEPPYKVSYGLDDGRHEIIATETTEYLTHLIQHLRPETRYFIEVRAFNASGESAPSTISATTAVFDAPSSLTVDELTDESASFSWWAPANHPGGSLYEIYLDDRHLATQAEKKFQVTGLKERTGHVFKVRAKGTSRQGGDYFSPYVSTPFTTRAYTGDRICAPGYLRSGRPVPTSIVLYWDEPYAACLFCPDASGYEISGEGIGLIEIARPPCVITGLSAEREYRFAVRAKATGNNISEASEILVGPALPDKKPAPPQNLRATVNENRTVTIAWDAPPGP